MTGWFAISLGDAMLAWDALDRIKIVYASMYGDIERCRGAAVFIRHETSGHLHCEVMAYFSPDAFLLAETLDAVLCSKPSREGLSLHAGAGEAWQTLFQ